MEQRGFIRSMLDVKVLILYVMSRVQYPLDTQKIYELCLQDDCVSYFDVCEAIPQMEESRHLEKDENGLYLITEKGKEDGALVEDSLAYPVAQRALQAVERFNSEVKRSSLVRTELLARPDGDYSVIMGLDDAMGSLMTLELMAPNRQQARKLSAAFNKNAEQIYKTVMSILLEELESPSKKNEPNHLL